MLNISEYFVMGMSDTDRAKYCYSSHLLFRGLRCFIQFDSDMLV